MHRISKCHNFQLSFSFGPSLIAQLIWPLLTSRSDLLGRCPFRYKTKSPQVRTQSFSAQPLDLRSFLLDHKSFAAMCPLALIGHASYLVFVHRLTDSLHTSFPRSVTLAQLCFTSLAVVSSREDFHLQDCAHAGRTHPPRPEGRSCFVGRFTLLRLVDVSLGRRVPSRRATSM